MKMFLTHCFHNVDFVPSSL